MKTFLVDDDLVALVWELADPRPFENLSFSDALRRLLPKAQSKVASGKGARNPSVAELLAELDALPEAELKNHATGKLKQRSRAPSPDPKDWVSRVPELSRVPNLESWKAICDKLGIEVAGDSARRRLRDWTRTHRPNWPTVPTFGDG